MRSRNDVKTDSSFLVVFAQLSEVFETVLKTHGSLNATQFLVLLKADEYEGKSPLLSSIAKELNIEQNVLSQACDALEKFNFAKRVSPSEDGRERSLQVSEYGKEMITKINVELREELYASFHPEEGSEFRKYLEASIYGAAKIDDYLSAEFVSKHIASAAVIKYCIIERILSENLKEIYGISYSDCRVLQRLYELQEPTRVVDLATQLRLPTSTITRASTRLEKAGLIQRLTSKLNRQAIFINLTDEGCVVAVKMQKTINAKMNEVLWSRLGDEYRSQVIKAGNIVAENIVLNDLEMRKTKMMSQLRPK